MADIDKEFLTELLVDAEWELAAESASHDEIADRILAGLQERGWVRVPDGQSVMFANTEVKTARSGGVTLKHDDKIIGRGADAVRDWRPTINGDTTGD